MPDDGLPHELPPITHQCPHEPRARTFFERHELWQLCELCYQERVRAWKDRMDAQIAAHALPVGGES